MNYFALCLRPILTSNYYLSCTGSIIVAAESENERVLHFWSRADSIEYFVRYHGISRPTHYTFAGQRKGGDPRRAFAGRRPMCGDPTTWHYSGTS